MQFSSSSSARPENTLSSAMMPASSPASSTTQHSTSHSVFNGVSSLFSKNPLAFASSLAASTPAAKSFLPTAGLLQSTQQSTGTDSPSQSTLSPFTGGQSAEVVKRQREREKRIMPARLQRVSNLLAGSTIEDELSGANPKQGECE
jgi:hypothetical protein